MHSSLGSQHGSSLCIAARAAGRPAARVLCCQATARRVQRSTGRAELQLPTSPALEQNPQPSHHPSNGSIPAAAPASAESSCPFLAALQAPPPSSHAWWERPLQLTNPEWWQGKALGGHPVVQSPWQAGMPQEVLVGDMEMTKAVLNGEEDTILTGNFLIGFSKVVGDEAVLTVQEPRHRYLRTLIMPAFDNPAIARLIPRMERVLTKYLERWADSTAAGAPVLGLDQTKAMTFEFIIAVIMGADLPDEELTTLRRLYEVWAAGLLAWPFINLPFTPFGKAMEARRQLIGMLQPKVDAARQQAQQGEQPAGILGSLVSAVDEDGNRLTDKQILENLLLMLVAGHDTSSVTLTNILAQLQAHPGAMQQLRNEQAAITAKHGAAFNSAVLREMDYAEAVIRETLRLRNAVPALTRQARRDFELGGYKVQDGTYVSMAVSHMAANDPRWLNDEPAAFKPERMLTPEGQKPGWLMPFGYGPRFCAGYSVAMAEMKVFLALLARSYDFDADINTRWVRRIGRVPENGLPLAVTRRSVVVQ